MNLNQSVVVSATGNPMFAIGGNTALATHEHKGYNVSLEWDEDDGEPLMLIWPARGGFKDTGVYGIALSSAACYADASGRPTEEGLTRAGAALPVLGKDIIAIELSTLMDVILKYLPDLLMMPPCPRHIRHKAVRPALLDIEQHDTQSGKTLAASSI